MSPAGEIVYPSKALAKEPVVVQLATGPEAEPHHMWILPELYGVV